MDTVSSLSLFLPRFGRSPERTTSHGGRSLRSAGGYLDGMDPEGEALHLWREA